MNNALKKYGLYILFVLVFLALSVAYKVKLDTAKKEKEKKIQEVVQGKEIVNVWLKEDHDTETRKYEIRQYNEENKDNIYISLSTYGEDYKNLLRTAVANEAKVDIFEYGFYELFRYERLMDMEQLGLDIDKIGKDKFMYYKKKPVGVKVAVNNVKFVWNKELLKGAGIDPNIQPKTWNEVIEYGEKIKKAYPDITPFEFPAFYYGDLRISIGENSVNKGNIYTTFWDYKKGEFNFDYARDILNVYHNMYSLGLLDNEYYDLTQEKVRNDFHNGKTAMIISTFKDKNYFANIIPLDFDIGISNLPKIDINDSSNYYFTNDYKCLVVNKNVEINEEEQDKEIVQKEIKHKEAVKKVYEWFLSEDMNKELLTTKKALPLTLKDYTVKNDVYEEYNNLNNFSNEIYDPSMFINYDSEKTKQLFYSAIDGTMPIDKVIEKLNSNFAAYCKLALDYYGFELDKFTE